MKQSKKEMRRGRGNSGMLAYGDEGDSASRRGRRI